MTNQKSTDQKPANLSNTLFTPEESLSLLIFGDPKVGKSTLATTVPYPALIIDSEGSWKFIRRRGFNGDLIRKVTWNPGGELPTNNGSWDICISKITSWGEFETVYNRLITGNHEFATVVIDSISDVQRRCKRNLVQGDSKAEWDDWGTLLTTMDNRVQSLRDLPLVTGSPTRCVLFIAEKDLDDRSKKYGPALEGAFRRILPHMVDISGYLGVGDSTKKDEHGKPIRVQKLGIGRSNLYVTGERVQGALPNTLENPDISQMMIDIYRNANN